MSLVVVPDRPEWLEVEDAMADAVGFVNLGNAQLVDVMVRALGARVCSGGGYLSPAHWLTVHAGVTSAHAHQLVRVAELAQEFAHVMTLFRAGKLSLDQTSAAMTAPPAADRRVAEFAELATVPQIRKFVRTVVGRPEPTPTSADNDDSGDTFDHVAPVSSTDGTPEAANADANKTPEPEESGTEGPHHSRSAASVSFGYDESSQFWLNARNLTTDQGMLVEAALNEARDHLFRSGHPSVTWADALAEICRRALTEAGTQRADRFKTYIHINAPRRNDHSAPDATTPDSSFDTTLANGVPVPPSIRDYLTCDTVIQAVWQQGRQPVGVGRTTRTTPNRLRRLLELRDQGCTVPGCTNTLGLQAHHIVPWSEGGVTELENLVLVCDAHHHQHHSGEISIAGNPNVPHDQPDGLTVTDRHGRSIRSHPTPRPPNGNERPPGARYQRPSGEPCNFRYLNWRPPPAA